MKYKALRLDTEIGTTYLLVFDSRFDILSDKAHTAIVFNERKEMIDESRKNKPDEEKRTKLREKRNKSKKK